MSKPVAYVHPEFVPISRVRIDPGDAGFVWGATITDRLRTFGGRPFRLAEHLDRFKESCRAARVPLVATDEQIFEATGRLIAENRHGDWELSVIWVATPGRKSGMAWWPGGRLSQFIAYTEHLTPLRLRALHRDGARLRTWTGSLGVDPRIKHRSRLLWWIASEETRETDPKAEPLFLDPTTGHVLESPTANLIAVLDGVVTSPPVGTVLNGVSLGVVRELCQANAIPFAERTMTLANLERASEILLTNTTFCVAGVSHIDDRPIPFPGPILNQLLDAWTDLVGVNVRPVGEC